MDDKVEQVICHLRRFLDIRPERAPSLHYFEQNVARMHYGTYRQGGYFIGSGAIESAGKQLTAAHSKCKNLDFMKQAVKNQIRVHSG